MLSVKAHIAVATVVFFGTFGVAILIAEHLLSRGWGEWSVLLVVLVLTKAAQFSFDRFVPAKCPRCGGEMYGDGDAFRWHKKCRSCEHVHQY